jgi:hypothetical protein
MMNSKTSIIAICGIMAAIASLSFLVIPTTPLFVIAYAFAILGIAALCLGSLYLFEKNRDAYPWFAAFPLAIWSYLTLQVTFSVIFIVVENVFEWPFPTTWFFVIHALMLAITAIKLIMLNVGKDGIVARDTEVREKVQDLRLMVLDIDAAIERLPSMKGEIKAVADALRYSDPIGNPALAEYENAIRNSVALIARAAAKGDGQGVPALCYALQGQIKDRNGRVKAMK